MHSSRGIDSRDFFAMSCGRTEALGIAEDKCLRLFFRLHFSDGIFSFSSCFHLIFPSFYHVHLVCLNYHSATLDSTLFSALGGWVATVNKMKIRTPPHVVNPVNSLLISFPSLTAWAERFPPSSRPLFYWIRSPFARLCSRSSEHRTRSENLAFEISSEVKVNKTPKLFTSIN